MSKKYVCLNRANLNADYLHTNSTTHQFLFGALAELVDNSRDAEANNLKIYTDRNNNLRGNYILNFLDDGTGMSPAEAADIIRFGKSFKRSSDKNYIGQYGNGLKSGSMRIGNDLLIFTKRDNLGTILLISETFLKNERIDEIVVPIPSFDCRSKQPIFEIEDEVIAREKFDQEMEILYKYTPFKNSESLISQFDKIENNGTLAMIYNLKYRLRDEQTELDFETKEDDILIRDQEVEFDRKSQFEHQSFRAYLSILYSNPRMKIYIQNKKVTTKLLERELFMPRLLKYTSSKFKNRAKQEKEAAEMDLTKAKNDLREAASILADYVSRYENNQPPDYYIQKTKLVRQKENAKKEMIQKEKLLEKRIKELREPKELHFIFGINIHNRDADGLFIYNSSRLIIMFEHTKNQRKSSEYRGIVGIVNVPYIVSRPTHNKQTFTDMGEQKELLKALGDYMDFYYQSLKDDVLSFEFWKSVGYMSMNPEPPSNEIEFRRKRMKLSKICLQCDKCLKWRIVRYHPNLEKNDYFKDNWSCKDNTDTKAMNCDVQENLEQFVEMDYHKVYETNFREIEATTRVIPELRPMPSQKSSVVTLVQKDKNSTVSSTILPRNDSYSRARSSLTESDSDTNLNGNLFDNSKKRRVRESDDENDPDYSNKNRYKTKHRYKNKNTPESLQNSYVIESQENNQILNTRNGRNNVKDEPCIDYESLNIGVQRNVLCSEKTFPEDYETCKSIAEKYRDLLSALVDFVDMPDLVQDLPKFSLEELNQVSINRFFSRFKDSVVELTKAKIRSKKNNIQKTLKQYLDNKERVSIDENYKHELFKAIETILP